MQGFDVAFYGDSILEHWLGTSQGTPWKGNSTAIVSQYDHAFGNTSDFSSRVFAIAGATCFFLVTACRTAIVLTELSPLLIAGDNLANLWWRLQQARPSFYVCSIWCPTGRLWCHSHTPYRWPCSLPASWHAPLTMSKLLEVYHKIFAR